MDAIMQPKCANKGMHPKSIKNKQWEMILPCTALWWVELRSCLCRPHLHLCIGLLRKRMRTFVLPPDSMDTLWHFLTSPIRCVLTPSKCWTCPNTFTINRGYSLEWPRWGHANTCMKNTPPHHARNDNDARCTYFLNCMSIIKMSRMRENETHEWICISFFRKTVWNKITLMEVNNSQNICNSIGVNKSLTK